MVSCINKPFIYKQVDYRGEILYENIKEKKSGSFYFPNMNFSYSLKKGKLNDKILLMEKGDTILFGNFKKNQPIGRYINRLYKCIKCKSIFRGTIIDKYPGEGNFDENLNKQGYWKQYNEEGSYINGKKNGVWKIHDYNDLENSKNITKKILYKNDSIVE